MERINKSYISVGFTLLLVFLLVCSSFSVMAVNINYDDGTESTKKGDSVDDKNEKLYPIQVRPRFTWHGGETPTALGKKKTEFDF